MRHPERVAESDAAHDLPEDMPHFLLLEARLCIEHVKQVATVDVPGYAGRAGWAK